MKTLDMRFIRYLNLFEQVTRVRTKNCFSYNNLIIFAVPAPFVSRAIGEQGRNIKQMSEILGKKIKVIKAPQGFQDLREFIHSIIQPIRIKNIENTNGELVIVAGRNKAALIGRNKARVEEMRDILDQYFGIKSVRIA